MEWTTHFLSGVTFGYLITNDWKGALVGGITSVIPDLDEPNSKFGKLFFFISIPCHIAFGHRTFTHSLFFVLLIGLIAYLVFDPLIAIASIGGVQAHILGDMLTGRVRLMYPLKETIGINVSRFNYLVIDRITRITLIIMIVLEIWNQIIKQI